MGIVTEVKRLFGFELSAVVASPESPWATSPIGQFTLDNLYKLGEHIRVTEPRARQLSVISRAEGITTGTIQRMPLFTANRATGIRLPAQPSLLVQPERGIPRSTTLRRTARAIFYHPATWWHVTERDAYGWPTFVRYVPQHEARTDDAGRLINAFGKDVNQDDVIDFVNPDGGLLVRGAETIRRSILVDRAAAHAESNPVPSIDLHNDGPDLETTEIDALITRWREARENGGIGYTSKTLKATPLGQPVEQLLIDARKKLELEQARHAGMPAWAVDVELAGTSLNYSNNASRWRDLLNLSAIADVSTIITDRLSLGDVTPATQTVGFDTDQFTRDDMTTRFTAYKLGKDGGFVTNDQIATWEGWASPAPEGSTK
ncbi:phage portal protein [Microterricola gilva]|uniref:phage portal protein n=1 Tax=Microterricola gilva TaxID=393267 RepID=UPI00102AF291|nr:phage portal protein [Microterricola gilva]